MAPAACPGTFLLTICSQASTPSILATALSAQPHPLLPHRHSTSDSSMLECDTQASPQCWPPTTTPLDMPNRHTGGPAIIPAMSYLRDHTLAMVTCLGSRTTSGGATQSPPDFKVWVTTMVSSPVWKR